MLLGVLLAAGLPSYFLQRGVRRYGVEYFGYVPPLVWILPLVEHRRWTLRLMSCDVPGDTIDLTTLSYGNRPPWNAQRAFRLQVGSRKSPVIRFGLLWLPDLELHQACHARDLNRDGEPELILIWRDAYDAFADTSSQTRHGELLLVELGSSELRLVGQMPFQDDLTQADVNGDGIPDFVSTDGAMLISHDDVWRVERAAR